MIVNLLCYNETVGFMREKGCFNKRDKRLLPWLIGVTKTNFGNIVRVYDMERTLCDLINNREKVPSELFAQTVKIFVKSTDKRMMVLFNYAEKMGITEDVQKLMEVYYE